MKAEFVVIDTCEIHDNYVEPTPRPVYTQKPD